MFNDDLEIKYQKIVDNSTAGLNEEFSALRFDFDTVTITALNYQRYCYYDISDADVGGIFESFPNKIWVRKIQQKGSVHNKFGGDSLYNKTTGELVGSSTSVWNKIRDVQRRKKELHILIEEYARDYLYKHRETHENYLSLKIDTIVQRTDSEDLSDKYYIRFFGGSELLIELPENDYESKLFNLVRELRYSTAEFNRLHSIYTSKDFQSIETLNTKELFEITRKFNVWVNFFEDRWFIQIPRTKLKHLN